MRLSIVLSYLTVYVVWGSTYFFIKLGVATMPPEWLVSLRFLLGGIGFLVFSAVTGRLRIRPSRREVLAAVLLGLCLLAGGNGLVSAAERSVDSYVAALVLAATPLMVAVFDRFLIGKGISRTRMVGISTGIGGVALLVYDGRSLAGSLSPGILLVFGGLTLWSLATSLSHRVPTPRDNAINTGVQMLGVGVLGTLACLIAGPSPATVFPAISSTSWLALGYLTAFGSLAFGAFTYLIRHEPAIRVVSYAFVNPLIALVLGLVLGAERPMPYLAAGVLLVLTGLALMLYGDRLLRRLTETKGDAGA